MSRSVRMPTPGCSGSVTTAAPTRLADMRRAACLRVCAGPIVTTSLDIPSRTCIWHHSPSLPSWAMPGPCPRRQGPSACAFVTLTYSMGDARPPGNPRRGFPAIASARYLGIWSDLGQRAVEQAERLGMQQAVGGHRAAAVGRAPPGQVGELPPGLLDD